MDESDDHSYPNGYTQQHFQQYLAQRNAQILEQRQQQCSPAMVRINTSPPPNILDTSPPPNILDEDDSRLSSPSASFPPQTCSTNVNPSDSTPPNVTVSSKVPAKKRGRPPKKNDASRSREWTDEEIYSLIEIWQEYENLYNTNNPIYLNKNLREKSLESIVGKLAEIGITATSKQVGKKLSDLKTYYGAQKRTVEASKSSGAGISDVYVSPWKFYEVLHFLNDAFTPRSTVSNADDSTYQVANPPSNKSAKKMKDGENASLQHIMTTASAALEKLVEPKQNNTQPQQQKGEDDCFCDFIKAMLNQIPECDMKDNLRLEIQHLILRCKKQINLQAAIYQ